MFKFIKKNIEAIFRGIRSAVSPAAPALPPPEKERKKFKKGETVRKQRGNGKEPYVRMADRRTPHNDGARKPKKKQQPSAKEQSVPKSHAKDQIPAVRTPVPMPAELIPPPEDPEKMRFFDLELAKEILAATQTLGFSYCTEIQKKCLPLMRN